MIAAHADLIDSLRNDQGVQNVEQLEKCATSVRCCSVGDLPDDDVVVKPVKFGQASGQQLQQRADVQAAQEPDHRCALTGLTRAQHLAHLCGCRFSQLFYK